MDVATISALTALFTAINGWQFWTVFMFIFLVPPLFGLMAIMRISAAVGTLRDQIRAQRIEDNQRFRDIVELSNKHFAAFEAKYESNIVLVRSYEALAGELASMVHLNTQAITRLVDRIDGGRFETALKR